MSDELNILLGEWASLGAGFNVTPYSGVVDLERLLLKTSKQAPDMARLFIVAATWLHAYGDLVAKHRLKRLIRDELDPEHGPVLGLLLDTAQQGTHPLEFQSILKELRPAPVALPLFKSSRGNPKLAALAERRASVLAQRWNMWCQPVELKFDALRPASWMMVQQPDLRTRADFRGDLRASIVASLRHDPGSGASEMRLAELAGGSRAQVRNALRNLEITGRVRAERVEGANRREVVLLSVA